MLEVEEGDTVYHYPSTGGVFKRKVTKVTKIYIWVCVRGVEIKYSRRTGKRVNYPRWHIDYITTEKEGQW